MIIKQVLEDINVDFEDIDLSGYNNNNDSLGYDDLEKCMNGEDQQSINVDNNNNNNSDEEKEESVETDNKNNNRDSSKWIGVVSKTEFTLRIQSLEKRKKWYDSSLCCCCCCCCCYYYYYFQQDREGS